MTRLMIASSRTGKTIEPREPFVGLPVTSAWDWMIDEEPTLPPIKSLGTPRLRTIFAAGSVNTFVVKGVADAVSKALKP